MDQPQVEAFVSQLENVQREEAYGYIFFFVGDDHMHAFVTIAQNDYEYDNVSNLSREGVFRINIGISHDTYKSLIAESNSARDYTVLNMLLPHPEYAKQHFVCILNPEGDNVELTKKLITEAHSLAAGRLQHKANK